jgi:trehalose/maltose hydrolase-like predicted phosphorylase
MIPEETFPVEPWHVRETRLDLNLLAQSESLFALSNGHVGLRGNLDEGEPYGLPGTYLNSFYETRPLPYAEAGYSYPEDGQSVVDVTNGKVLRLLVDDEPFDVRYGDLEAHERVLDMRAGTLTRHVRWTSPAENGWRSVQHGWCHLPSAVWRPSSTWWTLSANSRLSPCNPNSSRMRTSRRRPTIHGSPQCC